MDGRRPSPNRARRSSKPSDRGPADEQVTVVSLEPVEVGQEVERGEVIGELEATKSVIEISSPYSGVVQASAGLRGRRSGGRRKAWSN